jgi:NAD(P)-dependent dehydrogenase (short-subunit alcohol dehydrogenase family)
MPTVLITGASTGIGLATSQLFIEKGWNVAVTTRWAGPSSIPAKAHIFVADLTDEGTIERVVGQISEEFGRIDVLIDNAGYALGGPIEGMRPEQTERQFATNVMAPMHMLRHVVPIMRKQSGGTIINISSIGGRLAFPYLAAYHGTKFAIEGISESLRFELRPFGIKAGVNIDRYLSIRFYRQLNGSGLDSRKLGCENILHISGDASDATGRLTCRRRRTVRHFGCIIRRKMVEGRWVPRKR